MVFTQFFDSVHHLQACLDFRNNLLAGCPTSGDASDPDAHWRTLLAETERHLDDLAMDARLTGIMLITDHGKPILKRMAGIGGAATSR